MICNNCRYFCPDEEDDPTVDSGECRRRSPVFCSSSDMMGLGAWPVVLMNDWCGDFEAKEAQDQK